jgi:HJR/Mrr/RecB family endonuclease
LHDQEQLLKRREAAATARENSLVKVATEKSRIAILDEKAALERSKTQAEDYLAALRKTEATIFNWLERMDDKDRKVYEEMAANNKKYVDHGKNIDGFAFEQQVAALLEQNNFTNIHVISKSGDYGADITATNDEIKYVIQCKYYSSAVGIKAVQESYSAKDFYNAHVAVVATNNIFTKAATTLAEQLNVVLWDCEDLANMKKA